MNLNVNLICQVWSIILRKVCHFLPKTENLTVLTNACIKFTYFKNHVFCRHTTV